nr:uncharacterized protein LOC121502187 [Drosophila kikkawai]
MSSWVYLASKSELTEYAEEFGLNIAGKSEDLRRLLAAFVKRTDHTETTVLRLTELAEKYRKEKSPARSSTPAIVVTNGEERSTEERPTTSAAARVRAGKEGEQKTDHRGTVTDKMEEVKERKGERRMETDIVDRVRGWGIRYQGTTNPLEFLSKMEQWADGYGIQKDQLIQTMPFILEGIAYDWWNTAPARITTWQQLTSELLEHFLPPRYGEQLEIQIVQLKQRETEPVREYAMSVRKLMRFTKLTEEEKLDRVVPQAGGGSGGDRGGRKPHTTTPTAIPAQPGHMHALRRNRARSESMYESAEIVLLGLREKRHPDNRMLQIGIGKRQRPEQMKLAAQATRNPAIEDDLSCDGFQIIARIGIGKGTARGVVDTGASRSAISKNMYQDLRDHGRWWGTREEITLANGARQRAIGNFTAKVSFGGRAFTVTFMILKNVSGGILLGMDFLAGANSMLRCGNLELDLISAMDGTPTREEKDTIAEKAGEPSEEEVQQFLNKNRQVFEDMKGVSNVTEHKIYLNDDRPIKQRYYLRNPKQQAVIDEQVDELLTLGLIERSRSPYSAPVVLVRKKNNEWRMCIDYRQLNEKTEKDAYPVPRMNFILDQLREAKFISTIDLKSGYWQIPMEQGSRQYTAFTVPGRGLFQWTVMPFGLTTAPATFQRALDTIIGPEMEPFAFAYLDDIIVIGRTKREHLEKHLEKGQGHTDIQRKTGTTV